MGAGASAMLGLGARGERTSGRAALGDLPESCVAAIMTSLDPVEICRLARLNRAFSGAAAADFVWEAKLPGNYRYLLEKAEVEEREKASMGKKEIYARLCRPNWFDGGSKVFWIAKTKGRICMAISTKALSITGIDDRRYWNYIPSEESRFNTVAYLRQTWWFEVGGEIDFCFPAGSYSIFFRLQLGCTSKRFLWRTCDARHVHGWDKKPVRFQLSASTGQQALTQCYLDEPGRWMNYHVGDFTVEDSNVPTKVRFSMMQIDCTHTKGGLCVDSVLVYPKGCKPLFYAGW